MTRKGSNSPNDVVVKIRKLVKAGSGNSLYICVPREFLKRHLLERGDKVLILAGDTLKVISTKWV